MPPQQFLWGKQSIFHLFVLLPYLMIMAVPALAQESRGSIVGRVVDSTGAVVPGVTVTATNHATNIQAEGVSNPDGNYQIVFLNPGRWVCP